jgi:NADPH-dependent curcumin reductase
MPTGAHNRQIVLKSRPVGMPTAIDFAMVESTVPEPSDREVLIRPLCLSLNSYMRGRLNIRSDACSPRNRLRTRRGEDG